MKESSYTLIPKQGDANVGTIRLQILFEVNKKKKPKKIVENNKFYLFSHFQNFLLKNQIQIIGQNLKNQQNYNKLF